MKGIVAVAVFVVSSSLATFANAMEQFSGVIEKIPSYENIVISGKTYNYNSRTKVLVKGSDDQVFPARMLQQGMSVYYNLDYSGPGTPRVSLIRITGPDDAVKSLVNGG